MRFKPHLLIRFFLLVFISVQTANFVFVSAQVNKNVLQNKSAVKDLNILKQKGYGFLQSGNWLDANTVFEQILSETPDDYISLYGNGLALFNLRRISEAENNVQKAVEILSANNKNNAVLADSLVLSAVISAALGKNITAFEKLLKAVEIAPENFDANLSLGRAYFGNGDLVNAVKYFRRATNIQKNHLQARFFLATALERSGNLPEALEQYREVVKLNGNYAEGNLGLGVLLINIEGEKSVEGLNALQKAVSINGNLYEARINLGKTLLKLNRTEAAIRHLSKAAELAPNNPEPHYQLSLAYRKTGEKTKAAAELKIVKNIHEARRGVSEDQ